MCKKEVDKGFTVDYIKNDVGHQDEKRLMHALLLDLCMMDIDLIDTTDYPYPYLVKGHVDNLEIKLRYRYLITDVTKIEIILNHSNKDRPEEDNEVHFTLHSESLCNYFISSLGERIKLCL